MYPIGMTLTSVKTVLGIKHGVYIATDEPDVINETLTKYPKYEFIYDYDAAVRAKFGRVQSFALIDAIAMIHLLSRCDFIVCTFSSNIGRLSFELLEILQNGDFSESVVSLDVNYYFYGQQSPQKIAIMNHSPDWLESNEIELKVGDILLIDEPINQFRNQFDVYRRGRNNRTGASGRFSAYKVKDKWLIENF